MKVVYALGWDEYPIIAIPNQVEKPESEHILIKKLENKDVMPFSFLLKTIIEKENGLEFMDVIKNGENALADYFPNGLAWPLFSEKFKNLINSNKSEEDDIDWIRTNIIFGGRSYNYYVLRFRKFHDLLDYEKSKFVSNKQNLLIPHFSRRKIDKKQIFTIPEIDPLWRITNRLFISENLYKNIIHEKLTGLTFRKRYSS